MSNLSSSLSKGPPSSSAVNPAAQEGLSGLRQQLLGWFGGQEGKELPLHLPFPLLGRLMAAAVPAALRGSQASSQTSQHWRGCLFVLVFQNKLPYSKDFSALTCTGISRYPQMWLQLPPSAGNPVIKLLGDL